MNTLNVFTVLIAGIVMLACKNHAPADELPPSTSPTSAAGYGTIPALRVEATPANEIDGHMEVTVTLVPKMYQPIIVDYRTVDGSATAGADFEHTKGRLTFKPGETQKVIRIALLRDGDTEPREVLTLELHSSDVAIKESRVELVLLPDSP